MVAFPGLSQCQLSASPQDPSISSKPVLSRQFIYYQVWLACTKKQEKQFLEPQILCADPEEIFPRRFCLNNDGLIIAAADSSVPVSKTDYPSKAKVSL